MGRMFSKALECYKKNNLDEAEYLFNEAIKENSDVEKCLYNLAVINIKKEKFREALDYINRALEYDEKYEFMFNKTYCLYRLNEKNKARQFADEMACKFSSECLKDDNYRNLKANILRMRDFNSPVKKKVTNKEYPTVISFNSDSRIELIKEKLVIAEAKNDIASIKKYQKMLNNLM